MCYFVFDVFVYCGKFYWGESRRVSACNERIDISDMYPVWLFGHCRRYLYRGYP
jgi:hypothetical protein